MILSAWTDTTTASQNALRIPAIIMPKVCRASNTYCILLLEWRHELAEGASVNAVKLRQLVPMFASETLPIVNDVSSLEHANRKGVQCITEQ